MKLLKYVSGSLLLYFLFFSTGTQLTGCKPDPIFDTLYVRDTLTIRDTVDCNCYDLTDGLVAWYNFNGGSLNDSSGKNNHIVFNNAIKTTDRNGKPNNAYQFNGSSSYMRVANSTSLNPTAAITLSAIVKVNEWNNETCHGNQILVKTNNSDKATGFYCLSMTDHSCLSPLDTTKMRVFGVYGDALGANAAAQADSVTMKKNRWYHLVYTYENFQAKFYIDGVLVDARQYSSLSFIPNPGDLYFGKNLDNIYPYWFNGVIDDIRIYNRALCDGEVKQLNRVKI